MAKFSVIMTIIATFSFQFAIAESEFALEKEVKARTKKVVNEMGILTALRQTRQELANKARMDEIVKSEERIEFQQGGVTLEFALKDKTGTICTGETYLVTVDKKRMTEANQVEGSVSCFTKDMTISYIGTRN